MIHYIGWYIDKDEELLYTGNVPGKLKMRYVLKKLHETKKEVQVFSLAEKNGKGFYPFKKTYKSNGITVIYSGGVSGNGKLSKFVNVLLKKLQFILYIILKVKKTDTIILYHSVAFTNILAKLKKIFNRKVIIEVEEIYGYSATEDKPWVEKEIDGIKKMDLFIFVNEGIPKKLEINKEKYVVSYGVCDIPENHNQRFDDGKIHIVYAGTIEQRKQGALTAVETSRFLPDNYFMHIIGFGSNENIEFLQQKINDVNNSCGYRKVEYNGYYTGDELDDFLFKCHIGLSSNVMRPNFANNSFPSKVITYMCHDLSVVLGYAEAFYDVEISQKWSFYMNFEPQEIATAIVNTVIAPKGYYTDLIVKMDKELKAFFEKVC